MKETEWMTVGDGNSMKTWRDRVQLLCANSANHATVPSPSTTGAAHIPLVVIGAGVTRQSVGLADGPNPTGGSQAGCDLHRRQHGTVSLQYVAA